ncbi:MAG: hypothetical protein J4F41_01820, partial [Alphaproteobacteria bacterium]|nr:hypothetical protein [Alphaproteobacteria bacterium]
WSPSKGLVEALSIAPSDVQSPEQQLERGSTNQGNASATQFHPMMFRRYHVVLPDANSEEW